MSVPRAVSEAFADLQVRTRTAAVVVCGDASKASALNSVCESLGAEVEICASTVSVLAFADHQPPREMCVIATPLPDGPALPVIRALRHRGWQRIMVLSPHADARAIHGTLLQGVRSVVIRREKDAAPTGTRRAERLVRLSDRELEVLRMVADGRTNRQIGEQLGLSALTVKSHLARIARKMGCGDRAQMVAEAIRSGYID